MSCPQNVSFMLQSGRVDFEFWKTLIDLKVNEWKLDETPKRITGYVNGQTVTTAEGKTVFPVLEVRKSSLCAYDTSSTSSASTSKRHSWEMEVEGMLCLFNTPEAFRGADKNRILNEAARRIWQATKSTSGFTATPQANTFVLLVFADLKTHNFIFWFGFPGLLHLEAAAVSDAGSDDSTPEISKEIAQQTYKPREFCTFSSSVATSSCSSSPLRREVVHYLRAHQRSNCFPTLIRSTPAASGAIDDLHMFVDTSHTTADTLQASGGEIIPPAGGSLVSGEDSVYVLLPDFGSAFPALSWHHRNVLIDISNKCNCKTVVLHCIRVASSLVSRIEELSDGALEEELCNPDVNFSFQCALTATRLTDIDKTAITTDNIVAIGWEKNNKGQLAPRAANLRNAFDPAALAESSASLNLNLMRWRMIPSLDIARLGSLKVLLLGAGTLGCHVARDLLAWGVRSITFVDNGRVSYSNPVRQPLFEFNDAISVPGGKMKAEAAAEACLRIHPAISVSHYAFTIPMPGHAIAESQQASAHSAYNLLSELIGSHDVTFLLTDTRESRWLPTLLCAQLNKLAVTIALGFDTCLSMRHGVPHSGSPTKLGCYFCTDVVAPKDSTQNRTLDQQCTVTRPGLAPMASAMGVELLVSLLHHPLGFSAPAEGPTAITSATESALGLVPHQIRYFLTHFHPLLVSSAAFDRCTACSDRILSHASAGFEFVKQVCEDASILERMTGLSELHTSVDDVDTEWIDEPDE